MPVWEVVWTPAAKHSLLSIPWRAAARVDAAVMRFAETGEGRLDVIIGDPHGGWLRVGRYSVRMEIDPPRQLMTIFYVC